MPVNVNPNLSLDTGKNTCMNCSMRTHSLLNELSYNELEALNKNRYVVTYKAGETICKEGSKPLGLLCLNKGKVKITRRGVNGTEQIVALRKAVDFIGFRALMGENVCLSSAVALENVSTCIIDKNEFFKVIKDNHLLAFKIIRLFAHELTETDNRIINLTQKHIRARLADALLMINEVYGTCPLGILDISLKRSDLAALANVTTANTIRLLSSFVKEDLIEVNQRDIKIKNLKALKDISVFGR
jgi:CRP-like cAMP-binding protein